MTRLGVRAGIIIGVACVILAATGLPGCSVVYDVEVRGTVTNAADGKPLAGVLVELEAGGVYESTSPAVTASDGRFSLQFYVSAGQFGVNEMPRWTLKLTRDGLVAEAVDISPTREPKSGKGPVLIVVVVASMRAKP
jgi:hypothetical protein